MVQLEVNSDICQTSSNLHMSFQVKIAGDVAGVASNQGIAQADHALGSLQRC